MGSALVMQSTRLFAAADFLLQAMEMLERPLWLVAQPAPGQRVAEAPFTRAFSDPELVEAMALLIRMGFVEGDGA